MWGNVARLKAEVAELKRLARGLTTYLPDGVELSDRQRGLLEPDDGS